MTGRVDMLEALTERERQTLRLIARGHDAKSTASSLGLSVHTINERLRDARRKLAVSSSREAARLLLEAEEGSRPPPEFLGSRPEHKQIGDAADTGDAEKEVAPIGGARRIGRRPWIFGGVSMTLFLSLLALAALPQAASPPSPMEASPTEEEPGAAPDAAVVDAARQWLALVDAGRWDESYRATGAAFRKLNTARTWAAVSQRVRVPLGAVVSRAFTREETAPTPPHGYELVRFRTRFANRADVVETVALDREGDRWRVVGITVG